MTRQQRTDEELEQALEHFAYELRALDAGYRSIFRSNIERPVIEGKLFLEAFLVHARALIDFFYVNPLYDDDMVAQDFLPSPTDWNSERPVFPLDVDELRTAINKLLAHLTYRRPEYAQKAWQWKAKLIRSHLLETAEIFKSHLPPERKQRLEVPEPADPWSSSTPHP